ncbi:hypothetical protein FOMA001_g13375 [Fusarium oxysporum f. sp. matthiolae]|nr:hypothetical protein FOMA001_g13375 [Fusarium oxysporum f. sp. matthiolae]
MKYFGISLGLLVIATGISASVVPDTDGRSAAPNAPDGLYHVITDDTGKEHTSFIPFVDLMLESNSTTIPRRDESLPLNKRALACGPGSASRQDNVEAQECLKRFFGDTMFFPRGGWTYCVRGNAVAFICPYDGGFKPKSALTETFRDVDQSCGLNIMGYSAVSGGQGRTNAGRCVRSDHFCTKKFHAK